MDARIVSPAGHWMGCMPLSCQLFIYCMYTCNRRAGFSSSCLRACLVKMGSIGNPCNLFQIDFEHSKASRGTFVAWFFFTLRGIAIDKYVANPPTWCCCAFCFDAEYFGLYVWSSRKHAESVIMSLYDVIEPVGGARSVLMSSIARPQSRFT